MRRSVNAFLFDFSERTLSIVDTTQSISVRIFDLLSVYKGARVQNHFSVL